MDSLTDSPMYASGVFVGFSPARAALMKTAEVAQAILNLRLRISIQANDTPDEDDDDDSDNASIASWQTTDSAATDDVDDIFEEPPVTPLSRRGNIFTEVEEAHSEEHTTALIVDFIKAVTHYANKPVVETIVAGRMLGPRTRLELGLKMSWLKAVGIYPWVFEKVRKDVRALVREIRVSRVEKRPFGQAYNPIGQALWEIEMGNNLGSSNPAVKVVKLEKLLIAVLKSCKKAEEEKISEGLEQKEEGGGASKEGGA
ncbi:hypothetical protein TI39_contig4202g00040 [Zymoseptoria brevis]|uniref:Uncharacterized protein n=1 Tax=Zymoseptoria brevis TaxID=1047168 RepID=A0A0F4GBC4_9PEZI|nr:hypothetical protein TI39_contig4202g00040 [Zymoseptoria brevis]